MRLLSEATWRQLDPNAGRLSRRDLVRAAVAGAVVVVLLVAGYAMASSGLLVAHLGHGQASGYGDGRDTGVIHYYVQVVNEGRFPIEIVDFGRSGPGLEQVPHPPDPLDIVSAARLEPGEEVLLGIAYRVTDCDAVPDEPWPVPVRIDRWWGTQTVWIEPELPRSRRTFQLPPDSVDNGAARWDEDVEWQRVLADAHCYYTAGGQPWSLDDREQ